MMSIQLPHSLCIVCGHRLFEIADHLLPDQLADLLPEDCTMNQFILPPGLDAVYARSCEGGLILVNRRLERPRQTLIMLALLGLHDYIAKEE